MHPALKLLLAILLVGVCIIIGTAGGCFAGWVASKMSGSDFGPMLVGGVLGAVASVAGGVFLAVKLLVGKSD